MGDRELSYCELRAKEVVNSIDGKRMGRIVDILFSRDDGTVSGIVVPYSRRNVFSKNQDLFIPWSCVQKIGEDVILVRLSVDGEGRPCCKKEPPPKPPAPGRPPRNPEQYSQEGSCVSENSPPSRPNCDSRCEKCMLFDCAYRWQGV